MKLLYANDRRGAYPESWYTATATPLDPFPPLEGSATADDCVVGGGFTGLSAALHLAEAGRSVVLIDAQRVGFGASGRNGGQVGSGQRVDQITLEKRHGREAARQLWDIGEEAKALVKGLIDRHGIPARWRPGVAAAAYKQAEVAEIHQYADHMATAYGYSQSEPLDRAGIAKSSGSDAFAGGAVDWGAGHIHPLRFVLGLARAASAASVRIHEGTEALQIVPGSRPRVETPKGQIEAEHVILAANGYLGRLERKTAARAMPINNFILATEPLGTLAPEILPTDIAVADTRFVVNYWRKSEDGRLLFGGGESYGYRFPADIAALVKKPMLQVYPQLSFSVSATTRPARTCLAYSKSTRRPATTRRSVVVVGSSGLTRAPL